MKKLIKACVFNVEQYEPGKPIEVLRRELGLEGEICKMASNENPLGPSPMALEAVRTSLDESNLYRITAVISCERNWGNTWAWILRISLWVMAQQS